jgi:hypothetical protein
VSEVTGTGPASSAQPAFGRTWWGRAWLEALEQRAQLDPDRLPRGRDYARSGAVGDLTLAPGEARARVQGRKTEPYEVRIRVRRFTNEEWDRVLAAISARLGHAAALLDGELPPDIADDAASAGLDLLPGRGGPVQAFGGDVLPPHRCAGRRPLHPFSVARPDPRSGPGRGPGPTARVGVRPGDLAGSRGGTSGG